MKKGNIVIEYGLLIVFLALAILAMQKYILGGFCGRWKSAGDIFGYGRQYQPGVTEVTESSSVK